MIYHTLFLAKHFLSRYGLTDEHGQGLVEYALIILLIALVVVGGLYILGVQLNDTYNYIVSEFPVP